MTQTTDPRSTTSTPAPACTETHCPVCGKRYQRPNVNAADYRVSYIDQLGTRDHMCAHCWRTRPVL